MDTSSQDGLQKRLDDLLSECRDLDDVVDRLATAIHKMQETEQLILGPARQDGFDFDAFEKAWAAFEAART